MKKDSSSKIRLLLQKFCGYLFLRIARITTFCGYLFLRIWHKFAKFAKFAKIYTSNRFNYFFQLS